MINQKKIYAVFGVMMMGSILLASSATAQVACGDIIRDNAKLEGDLNCPATAVTVTGGRLDMAGYTVTCTTDGDGIRLNGTNSRVLNGTVTGCRDGVVFSGTGNHRVSRVTSMGNIADGFDIRSGSNGNMIKKSAALGNGNNGIEVASHDNQVLDNTVDGNGDEGIWQEGGDGNHYVRNRVTNNVDDGIQLDNGDSSHVINNYVEGNGQSGVDLNDSTNENQVHSNRIVNNFGSGIDVALGSDNNVISGNTATGNNPTWDILEANVDCGTNIWDGNKFGTSNMDCVN